MRHDKYNLKAIKNRKAEGERKGGALVVWRKFPVPNEFKRQVSYRTICEIIRELHKDAKQREDAVCMSRLGECYDMAKRMQRKLVLYNKEDSLPSLNTTTDDRVRLTVEDVQDIVEALNIAQRETPTGAIKVRWDTLIDYFKKHLCE